MVIRLITAGAALCSVPAMAVVPGQIDTFEDGTTQGWVAGASHPFPPVNVATGGPAGVDDNFLLLTSLGTFGPGGRVSAFNLVQWSGDYLALGVGGVTMDVRNLGSTDLSLRLLIADPLGGPPANVAFSTDAVLLPAGGTWTTVSFPISTSALTPLLGDVESALHNATELRLFHSVATTFPGEPVNASLGVDNITATAVPEASTWTCLLGLGVAGTVSLLRRRA